MKATYKSLYPSITIEHNIAPNTLEGYIFIPERIWAKENINKLDRYQRGGEFIENMVCDNHIEFCHRWFHLANVKEMIDDIKEYHYNNIPNYSADGQIETYGKTIVPFGYSGNGVEAFSYSAKSNPFVFYGERKREKV